MGEALERLQDKVELARKWVPPHVKVVAGKTVRVEGYWQEGGKKLRGVAKPSGPPSKSAKPDEGPFGGWEKRVERGTDYAARQEAQRRKAGKKPLKAGESDPDRKEPKRKKRGEDPEWEKRVSKGSDYGARQEQSKRLREDLESARTPEEKKRARARIAAFNRKLKRMDERARAAGR